MFRIAAIAAIAAILATPALADPNCLAGDGPGLHIEWGVRIGGPFTESEQAEFDKMRLQRIGVDAFTVERTTLGCLKVWRVLGGRYVLEYYNARTLDPVPIR